MGNPPVESNVSELLARVTKQLKGPVTCDDQVVSAALSLETAAESVLLASAARYCPPANDSVVTPPTGFDFEAGVLFEAVVESAFLVANADGHFDDVERRAFSQVVLEASGRRVSVRQIEAIVTDLSLQLEQDGLSKRVVRLATTITKHAHRREALLISVLLAEISSGISDSERRVLLLLAQSFELPPTMLDELLTEVRRSLTVQA
jgi:tellurite resistance protein